MEVCITKKLFMTVDIDVPDDATDEVVSSEIKKIVESSNIDDWDEYDWRGREVYEAYDTYSGSEIELDF
jgi:hypothetical protein